MSNDKNHTDNTLSPFIFEEDMPLNIFDAGTNSCHYTQLASEQYEPINCCRFEYVLSGKGRIEIGNDITNISAGDFFFINKETEMGLYSDKNDPMKKIYVCVGGALVDELISAYDMDVPLIVCRIDVCENLKKVLQILKDTDSFTPQIYDEIGDEILKIIRKVYHINSKSEGSPSNKIIAKKIMGYIEWNFTHNFTIEDMAKTFSLGKTQLIKHFKDHYGATPMKFLQDKRLEVSKHYLKNTDVPISSIPEAVGFSNITYFSAAFKASTGVSPREYRKLYKKRL